MLSRSLHYHHHSSLCFIQMLFLLVAIIRAGETSEGKREEGSRGGGHFIPAAKQKTEINPAPPEELIKYIPKAMN